MEIDGEREKASPSRASDHSLVGHCSRHGRRGRRGDIGLEAAQLVEVAPGGEHEHAAVPEVLAVGDEPFGVGEFRLLDELGNRAQSGGPRRHPDVAVPRRRMGGDDTERDQGTVQRGLGSGGHRLGEGDMVVEHVIGGHHEHHRTRVDGEGGNGHRGRGVAAHRFDDHPPVAMACCLHLVAARRRLHLAAHHNGRPMTGDAGHPVECGAQHRVVVDQGEELFRGVHPRGGPQPGSRATGEDHRYDDGAVVHPDNVTGQDRPLLVAPTLCSHGSSADASSLCDGGPPTPIACGLASLDVDPAAVRSRFPALSRTLAGVPVVYADGPGGTQVVDTVIEAVAGFMAGGGSNLGGPFATSEETQAVVDSARAAAADLFGAERPDEIVFGQNMTSLTLALGRALARTWRPSDEIVCTTLDHDANVSSWMQAAAEADATVRLVDFDLGAVGSTPRRWRPPSPTAPAGGGHPRLQRHRTVVDVASVVEAAPGVGALAFVDACTTPLMGHRRRHHRLRLPRRIGVQVLRAAHRDHVRPGRAAGRTRRGQDQAGPERGPGQVGERHPELREPGGGNRRRRLLRLVGRGGSTGAPGSAPPWASSAPTRQVCPAVFSTGSPGSRR